MKIPRIMLGAISSGSGKTLLTCALIGALKEMGIDVASCKCGPDYIDPMFHRSVLKIPSENMDTFFTGEDTKNLLCSFAKSHECVVMEGVMGLFDGLAGFKEQGSSYHLASVTKTPIILVVDVHGMGRSMIPVIQGVLAYDKEHLIKGIILNRMSKGFYETMKEILSKEIAVPVVGIYENHKKLHLESRHLGLCMPQEIAGIEEQLKDAAAYFRETVDLEEILRIASSADSIESEKDFTDGKLEDSQPKVGRDIKTHHPRLAVARDEAFCFYYDANLRALEEEGIEIVYFSPLHDTSLPEGIQGILLGGGYPENYVKELSANEKMLSAIGKAINAGLVSIAECGGFMYLHKQILVDGESYEMVGAIDGYVENKGKLVRFGYVEIAEKESFFLPNESTIKGHEFHYFDSTDNGTGCILTKPVTGKSWEGVHTSENHWWGFPHLYWPSNKGFVRNLKKAMERV